MSTYLILVPNLEYLPTLLTCRKQKAESKNRSTAMQPQRRWLLMLNPTLLYLPAAEIQTPKLSSPITEALMPWMRSNGVMVPKEFPYHCYAPALSRLPSPSPSTLSSAPVL